jgi:hypothetical protein
MKMPTRTRTTKQSLEPVELRSRLKIVIGVVAWNASAEPKYSSQGEMQSNAI